jgi:hypothetical protein
MIWPSPGANARGIPPFSSGLDDAEIHDNLFVDLSTPFLALVKRGDMVDHFDWEIR